MRPSDEQIKQLTAYAERRDERRNLDARREQLGQEIEASEDAALSTLQGVGAIAVPVKDGEWHLRADRDESGPFVDTRYEDEQWSA